MQETVLFDDQEGWDHSHMSCWYNFIFGQTTEKLIPEIIVELRRESELAIRIWKKDGHIGMTLAKLYSEWLEIIIPNLIKKGKLIELKQIDFKYYLDGRPTSDIHRDIENKIDIQIGILTEHNDTDMPHPISIFQDLKKDILKIFIKHENKT